MHHDQLTTRAILTGLAERHRPPPVNVDEESELARVCELLTPRTFTETSLGMRVEDEAVARRQPADPRVPCHTSYPLRRCGNHLTPGIDRRREPLPEQDSHCVGGRVRLSSSFALR